MVRFGIVGTSKITEEFLKAVALASEHIGVSVQAVCSRSEDTGRAYADKHSIPFVYTSVEALAQSEEIDAIYIASPNYAHAANACEAMRAGKHVLVEKPMAANAREVAKMVKVAGERGVLLMEAMKSTVQPGMQAVRDNLHKIGQPRKYFASYCQYSSRYDAFKQGVIANAFKPELANGALLDIGVYTLHPLVQLFGEPQSVQCVATKLSTGVDGSGSIVMGYESGIEAAVLYSKIADSHLPAEIQGEADTLLIDRNNEPREIKFVARDGKVENLQILPVEHGMVDEVLHFVDLIERGLIESPYNTHSASLAVAKIMDEARTQIGLEFPADKQ